jgi:shikimate kinase
VASGEWRVASEEKIPVRGDRTAERNKIACLRDQYAIGDHTPLFLIGPRGSGKTTIARLLAERLGWDGVDADDALESRYGKSVRAIFAEEGEAGFREKESLVLAELCGGRRCVVSTGGGVVVREANRALLRASGYVVWLTADAETLWRRLQEDDRSDERRPVLTVGGRAEVEEVLRVREPWYRECAHLTVRTEGRPPEAVADEVFKAASGIFPSRARSAAE